MMSKKAGLIKTTALLLCSTVLFCGCVKNSDVVIKVNDQEITKGEYFEDFNRIKNAQFKNAPKEIKKDDGYAVLSLKERYSNDVIMRALLKQEFDKRDIKVTEEEIADKKKKIIAQIGSEEQFKNLLKENNISDEKLHSDLKQEVQMDKLISSLGVKDASDSEAQAFYNKNKDKFNMPERVRVSHILIETSPEAIKRQIADSDKEGNMSMANINEKAKEEAAKKEALAKEVLAKVQANPKNFAKLAQEYSEDRASAEHGGDIGYITKEAVVKEFGDAAFSQKIGVVGPLVKTQFGYHIIIVKDKAKAGMQPFNQVKNDLKAYLTQQKKMEKMDKFLTGLKDSATIEFVDESLDPKNIQNQLNEALKKQIEKEGKARAKETVSKDVQKDSK